MIASIYPFVLNMNRKAQYAAENPYTYFYHNYAPFPLVYCIENTDSSIHRKYPMHTFIPHIYIILSSTKEYRQKY